MKSKSESIKNLMAALSKAQGEFKPVQKTREVDFTDKNGRRVHYKYADLQDILNMALPILSKHEISITQSVSISDVANWLDLETTIAHSSGEYTSSVYPIRMMQRPQEQGSEITYARRYTLAPALGLHAEDDDDGGAANEGNQSKEGPKKPPIKAGPPPAKPLDAPMSMDPPTPPKSPGEYVITFGKKWKGFKIGDMTHDELRGYIDWLKNEAKAQGKEIDPHGPVGDLMFYASQILPPIDYDSQG